MTEINTPRFDDRISILKKCFTESLMDKAWRKYVKVGFRNQDLLDLHDYYDFHRNRKTHFKIIIEQIIEGRYKPKQPLIIRLEKSYGVCRHIQIPTPEDAVVLQTLVEYIVMTIINGQPSKRAFFSRSYKQPKKEDDIDETFSYAWFELWPEFQQRIFEFTKIYKYIVVTDIANFFDTISLSRLRNSLTSIGIIDECLLDFLFYMLESFVWLPDYLPYSGVGLPQVNFDAPRLLAHAFLFEIDKYLDKKTGGNFVRWMDDIDFGVQSYEEAKEILRGLDELLLTRGLRLNLGKTKILSSEEAKDYFLPDENRWITIMKNSVKWKIENKISISKEKKDIRKRFVRLLKTNNKGRNEKVIKRYIDLFTIIKDPFVVKFTPYFINDVPELRDSIFKYYEKLGFNEKRFEHIRDFYLTSSFVDDKSVFGAALLLIKWNIEPSSNYVDEILRVVVEKSNKSHTNLAACIWIYAKYASEQQIKYLIYNTVKQWRNSNFLARQVAAITPRMQRMPKELEFIEKNLVESGQLEGLRVFSHLKELRKIEFLDQADKSYILHGNLPIIDYPIQKFLLLINYLECDDIQIDKRIELLDLVLPRLNNNDVFLKYIMNMQIFKEKLHRKFILENDKSINNEKNKKTKSEKMG